MGKGGKQAAAAGAEDQGARHYLIRGSASRSLGVLVAPSGSSTTYPGLLNSRLPVYLSAILPACLPCLPAHLPAHLPGHLPTNLPTYLPTHLRAHLPTCLPLQLIEFEKRVAEAAEEEEKQRRRLEAERKLLESEVAEGVIEFNNKLATLHHAKARAWVREGGRCMKRRRD